MKCLAIKGHCYCLSGGLYPVGGHTGCALDLYFNNEKVIKSSCSTTVLQSPRTHLPYFILAVSITEQSKLFSGNILYMLLCILKLYSITYHHLKYCIILTKTLYCT